MSTADSVNITPPTDAFRAIVQKYENDIRQAAEAQMNSTPVAMLDLPDVCKGVEEEFFKSHHEKTVRDYSTNALPAYKPAMFLFNGGSFTPIRAGFVVPTIPLLLTGSVTARVRFPQKAVEVPLQEGSVVCFAAGAEEVYLDTLGDGKVVWVFLFYKVKA